MKIRVEMVDCAGRRKPRVVEFDSTPQAPSWMQLMKVLVTREGESTEEFMMAISTSRGRLTMEKKDIPPGRIQGGLT